MQIVPTSTTNGALGFFQAMDQTDNGGQDFMSAMQDAFEAVKNGESPTATAALAENSPLVESPYTRHTTDGVTYTLSEVCFTKQELQELRLELLKAGAPQESLDQFNILVDQPAGATLAQVIASLTGGGAKVQFSDEDEHAITALLGQIDPSGELAGNALSMMREGNGQGALELIQSALANMGVNETIEIDLDSMLALGRGLGLNADSMNQISQIFGKLSGLSVNGEQFDTLMTPAKNQFMADAANAAKLNDALEKTIRPIISKARDRMEKEKAASELQNRRVEQSRILIDRTVQQNSRDMMDATVTGESASAAGNHAENMRQGTMNQMQDMNAGAMGAKNATDIPLDDKPSGQGSNTFGDNRQQNSSNGWNDLLGRMEARTAQPVPQAASSSSFVYSMLNAPVAENFAPQAVPAMADLPQALASQVQTGMLTAMQNGSTRLDLQLHPAELGAITITLVARNGEVTARILSEKGETADMLTREMDAIRINLEQQGVKVDKIEVQLESNYDNAQGSLDDLGQHNARQEENARRQELARMRNLATLRNNSENSENSTLARTMHNIGQSARYAGQSVYVVA